MVACAWMFLHLNHIQTHQDNWYPRKLFFFARISLIIFQKSSLGLCKCHQRLSLLCDLAALGKGANQSGFQQQSSSAVPHWYSVNNGLCTFRTKSQALEARAVIAARGKKKKKMENIFFSPPLSKHFWLYFICFWVNSWKAIKFANLIIICPWNLSCTFYKAVLYIIFSL